MNPSFSKKESFTLIELLVVTPVRKSFQLFVRGKSPKASFTLIELLVVIAILAILSVTVVFVLNPSDLIKQSRDSTRLTDLNNLNKALGLFQVTNPGSFQGTSTVVYVSIPDTTTTCANLGLPTLPTGYTYSCVSTSTLAKNDGTGWIPVPFSQISYGSVISRLPTDPINTTSSGNYYTYIPGGSWELDAILESSKYRYDERVSKTNFPGVIAVGSNLSLSPMYNNGGLIAFYSLASKDLLTASTISDLSGNGYTGTITAGASAGFQPDQRGQANRAYDFDGANTKIDTGSDLIGIGTTTVSVWLYADSYGESSVGRIISNGTTEVLLRNNTGQQAINIVTAGGTSAASANGTFLTGQWNHLVATIAKSGTADVWLNGIQIITNDGGSALTAGANNVIIGNLNSQGATFDGRISDFRIYNRTLSVAEIKAIYNATK